MNAKPWDIFKNSTEYLSEEEAEKRLNICKNCEFFFTPTSQCKKCGCFMNIKTKMSHASCPINKW
jgi:hypothetical protein